MGEGLNPSYVPTFKRELLMNICLINIQPRDSGHKGQAYVLKKKTHGSREFSWASHFQPLGHLLALLSKPLFLRAVCQVCGPALTGLAGLAYSDPQPPLPPPHHHHHHHHPMWGCSPGSHPRRLTTRSMSSPCKDLARPSSPSSSGFCSQATVLAPTWPQGRLQSAGPSMS